MARNCLDSERDGVGVVLRLIVYASLADGAGDGIY